MGRGGRGGTGRVKGAGGGDEWGRSEAKERGREERGGVLYGGAGRGTHV